LSVNGELRDAAKVSADHAAVVAAASELLDAVGERLLPGDRILAGSLTHVPVVRGDSVLAEIDGLGSLTARIA
jgi:2-keto-4-pentenoate hydratase